MLHHSSPKLKVTGAAGLLIGASALGLSKLTCDKADSMAPHPEPVSALTSQDARNSLSSTTKTNTSSRPTLNQPTASHLSLKESKNAESSPVASEVLINEEQFRELEKHALGSFPGKMVPDGSLSPFPFLEELADLIFPPPPLSEEPITTKPAPQNTAKQPKAANLDYSQTPPFNPPGVESLTFDYPPTEWRKELSGQVIVCAELLFPRSDDRLWNDPEQLINQRAQAYSHLRAVLSAEALEALAQEAWLDETVPEELKAKILIDVLNDRGGQIEQPDQSPGVLYLEECRRNPGLYPDTAGLSELLSAAPLEEYIALYRENSADTDQARGRRLFIIQKMQDLLANGPAPLTKEQQQQALNFLLEVGFLDSDSGVQYEAASLITQFSTGNKEELGRLIFQHLASEEIKARGLNPVVYARFHQQAKALLFAGADR